MERKLEEATKTVQEKSGSVKMLERKVDELQMQLEQASHQEVESLARAAEVDLAVLVLETQVKQLLGEADEMCQRVLSSNERRVCALPLLICAHTWPCPRLLPLFSADPVCPLHTLTSPLFLSSRGS